MKTFVVCTARKNLNVPGLGRVKPDQEFTWTGSEEQLEKWKAAGHVFTVSVSGIKNDPGETAKLLKELETSNASVIALRTALEDANAQIEKLRPIEPVEGKEIDSRPRFEGLVSVKSGKLAILVQEPGDLSDGEKVEIYRPLVPAEGLPEESEKKEGE
jgi:hypothetical protein